jgi:hypothetical protein
MRPLHSQVQTRCLPCEVAARAYPPGPGSEGEGSPAAWGEAEGPPAAWGEGEGEGQGGWEGEGSPAAWGEGEGPSAAWWDGEGQEDWEGEGSPAAWWPGEWGEGYEGEGLWPGLGGEEGQGGFAHRDDAPPSYLQVAAASGVRVPLPPADVPLSLFREGAASFGIGLMGAVAVSVAVASGADPDSGLSLDALLSAAFGYDGGGGSYEENLLIAQAVGEVRKGVADIEAAAPPEPPTGDGGARSRECPVCMESSGEGAGEGAGAGAEAEAGPPGGLLWRRTARCGHLFCSPCAEKWFRYSVLCPICKTDVSEGHGGYEMRDEEGPGLGAAPAVAPSP